MMFSALTLIDHRIQGKDICSLLSKKLDSRTPTRIGNMAADRYLYPPFLSARVTTTEGYCVVSKSR